MIGKGFVLALLLVGVNCRYLLVEERPMHLAEDGVIIGEDGAVYFPVPIETFQEEPLSRVRRQAQTTISVDGKTGNPEFSAKIPVARNDNNLLSLTGSQSPTSRGLGVTLENAGGHALSVSQKTIPDFGQQLTAAGKVNLLDSGKHNVDATAFITKNMPTKFPDAPNFNTYGGALDYTFDFSQKTMPDFAQELTAAGKVDLLDSGKHNVDASAFITKNMPTKFPDAPNFNTYGGALDYTFDKKIGATLGAAQTDFLKRTDVSALGHLNLFKNQDTSFDFNAGATRSFSPYIPKSSWEPTFGFSWTKSW